MPNRAEQLELKIPKYYNLDRLREILREKVKVENINLAEAARNIKDPIKDRSYLDKIISGERRFNEDSLKAICEYFKIPLYIGVSPPINVHVRYAPKFKDPGVVELRQHDYYSVPIVDPSVVARIPFTVTNDQVKDIAYIHHKAFRNADASKCICMVVSTANMEPTIRKGAIISIDMGASFDDDKDNKSLIWALRKDNSVVIGRLQGKDNMLLLVSENRSSDVESFSSKKSIIGKVNWVWQSLI